MEQGELVCVAERRAETEMTRREHAFAFFEKDEEEEDRFFVSAWEAARGRDAPMGLLPGS